MNSIGWRLDNTDVTYQSKNNKSDAYQLMTGRKPINQWFRYAYPVKVIPLYYIHVTEGPSHTWFTQGNPHPAVVSNTILLWIQSPYERTKKWSIILCGYFVCQLIIFLEYIYSQLVGYPEQNKEGNQNI